MEESTAAAAVQELRARFVAGQTRPAEWRAAQLRGVLRMATGMEAEICDALHADLAKPKTEAHVHEISLVKSSCLFALKYLKKWMKPRKVHARLMTFPSTARIAAEPLGVVLVISAWNYPLLLSLDPVIGAIAAGNAVVLKPSEVAPSTSSLLAELLPRYVDSACIKVVEGGVPETTALLEQQWDKIFYTGNSKVGRIVMASAAKHLTPVVLELGGKCPVVVDSNVNLHVDKIHESLGLINSMTKPLAAYLFTRDSKLQKQFERTVSAGGMLLNDTSIHLTNPHLPFGGVGESGTGAYHGKFSFDAFSHRKAVLHRGFGGEAKARYPPYSSAKLKILKGVLEGKLGAMIQAILGFPRGK